MPRGPGPAGGTGVARGGCPAVWAQHGHVPTDATRNDTAGSQRRDAADWKLPGRRRRGPTIDRSSKYYVLTNCYSVHIAQ